MGMFVFSGVYLKVNEEIENLIIKEYVKENGPLDNDDDKGDIISDAISYVGGVKFWPENDYGRKIPISNEGLIDWGNSEVMGDYENYIYVALLNDKDLTKPMLNPNKTLTDLVLENEYFTFISKDYEFKSELEFYWLEVAQWDD